MHRNTIRRFGVALGFLALTPACINIPSFEDTGDLETDGASEGDADSIADEGDTATSSMEGDTGSDSADSADTAESDGGSEDGSDSDSGDETGRPDPTCEDGAQNGTESDVDCGGDSCAPCAADQTCVDDSDCASSICTGEICQAASCGDGVLQAGEECDEGGETAECDLDCTFSQCGDSVLNTTMGEQCDDAGRTETCNDNCQLSQCGDGSTNEAAGESCDDGGQSPTCNDNCSVSTCGDGIPNTSAGEACDSAGNTESCDADCSEVSCGDGFVNDVFGEACDDAGESETCNADCTAASCGDGIVNAAAGETCEDGNDDPADGCKACKDAPIGLNPECYLDYNVFGEADRSTEFNDEGVTVWCDSSTADAKSPDWAGAGWYRFDGPGGYMLPETAPGAYACATHAAGWLDGEHPSAADGAVTRTVCYDYTPGDCWQQQQIEVVNCESFYLYNVPETLSCSYRYCADDAPTCGNGLLDDGEDCDDGNTEDADACPNSCVLPACLSFTNTGEADVSGAGWFDECVEKEGTEVRVLLRDGEGNVVYDATGTKVGEWTYDALTSTMSLEEQYGAPSHDRIIELDNGDFLRISGKNASNGYCGGDQGNGYVIIVYAAPLPGLYGWGQIKMLVAPYIGPIYDAGQPRKFANWSAEHEISWAGGSTMDSCTAGEGGLTAFQGSFEFQVQ